MADILELDPYSTEAIQRRLERALRELEVGRAARAAHVPDPASDPDRPSDCVRQFPVVGEMAVELVAFDFEGHPRLAIRFGSDVPLAGWEDWMIRWTRRRYGRRLLAKVD